MSAEFFTACERLLSATANGVYQGILVAVLAGLILHLFVRTNAATRHAVWFGVLLFVTALIPAHLLLYGRPPSAVPPAVTPPASSTASIAPAPPVAGKTANSPADNPAIPVSPSDEFNPASLPIERAGRDLSSSARTGALPADNARSRWTPPAVRPFSSNLVTPIRLPHSICLCLVIAWVLLASLRAALMAWRVNEVRRAKTTSAAPSQALQTLFDKLRDSLPARRHVQLRISTLHRNAVVLGFVHPVVLLPAEMDRGADDAEVEHVLRHELAHVDRRDDWANLAQQLLQAALFFHPAVWWISRRLSLEREIACDDHVLQASPRPRAYALTLANAAGRMSHRRHLLAPGVSSNHSQLQQRITMILNTHRNRSPRLARSLLGFFTTATAILAVLAVNAAPRLILAQSSVDAPSASAPVNIAPPSPDALLADAGTAALPPNPGVESGPRIKSPNSDDDAGALPPPEIPAEPPQPPEPLLALVAPTADALLAVEPIAGVPPLPQVPPESVSVHPRKNMSVEERLDRIERILEDLQSRTGMKGRHRNADDFQVNLAPGQPLNLNVDMAMKLAAEDVKRAADEARRAAQEGQRAALEGQRSAEQAMRDMAKMKNKDFERLQENLRDLQSEGPARELEALRNEREALQKQMESIQRQIQRLEKDRDRQKTPEKGRSDDNDAEKK